MSESEHTGKLSQNKRNRTIATVCVVAAVAVAAVGGSRFGITSPASATASATRP